VKTFGANNCFRKTDARATIPFVMNDWLETATTSTFGCFSDGLRATKIFCPRGSAQAFEKAQSGQGNPRKTKQKFCLSLIRLSRGLARLG
jgi:hypothetical protein